MKKFTLLMALMLILLTAAAGCGSEDTRTPTVPATKPTETVEIRETEPATEPVTEPEITEAPTAPATEPPVVSSAPVPEYPAYTEPFDLPSEEELYRINIFLSNFSEQWFNESDYLQMGPKSSAFYHEEAVNARQMVSFAFTWYKMNSYKSLGFTNDGMTYLTRDQINQKLDRYFGLSLSDADFEACGYQISGDRVLTPTADGESHPNFTVVRNMWGNGQGTYLVEFSIFSLEEASYGGNMVSDKNWYRIDWDSARVNSELTHYRDGYAIVRPYQSGNVNSYNLLYYRLDGQSR